MTGLLSRHASARFGYNPVISQHVHHVMTFAWQQMDTHEKTSIHWKSVIYICVVHRFKPVN